MKVIFALFLSSIIGVSAHTSFAGLIINGVGRGDCVRPKYDYPYFAWPTHIYEFYPNGINGENYTCGFLPKANQEAPATCEIAAGSKIRAAFSNPGEKDQYPILIEGHKGPILIYLAKYNHGKGGVPSGAVWFKIAQFGYPDPQPTKNTDADTIQWAAPYMLWRNNGRMNVQQYGDQQYGATDEFVIPGDLAPGDYMLRAELISLENTGRGVGFTQNYMHCAQIRITGGGNADPPNKVAFPGAYGLNDPGLTYVIWRDFAKVYPFPGPPVYVATTPTPTPPPVPTPPAPTPAPVTPTPVPSPAGVAEFFWSSRGIRQGSCVQIVEPEDPNSWHDNYLCSTNTDLSYWIWSSEGPVTTDEDGYDYKCVQWLEESDKDSWDDNHLCYPVEDKRKYAFSSKGPIPGMTCVRTSERLDPNDWRDNYWCTAAADSSLPVNVGYNGYYNRSDSDPFNDEPSNYIGAEASNAVATSFSIFVFAIISIIF